MTTNRMGLEKALSDERLKLFIRQPLDNGLTRGEQMELVREALARRKASKEVYGYVNKAVFEMTGSVGLSNDHEHCADSPSYIPLYAAPPLQAVTVPDGWQLMPTELTSVMRNAWDSAQNGDDDNLNMQNAYRAMIAASPSVKNEPQSPNYSSISSYVIYYTRNGLCMSHFD